MSAWEEPWQLGALDVGPARRLRLSALLGRLEQASIAHTTALGMGREKTLDRGLLWALSRIRLEFARQPVYGERLTLATWPGETLHALFPRYYELRGESGERVMLGCALWLLMDERTRTMAFPDEHGVCVPGLTRGCEPPLPPALLPFAGEQTERTVLYSDTDLNGHMNNARYADWADDLLGGAYLGAHTLRLAQLNYQREALEGRTLLLKSRLQDGALRAAGRLDAARAFDLLEEFV